MPCSPGPAGLLPQRGAGAGPAGEQHRVEAGDVDTELERAGRCDSAQVTGGQALLQQAALLGEEPGPVGGHGAGQIGVDLLQRVPREKGDDLGAPPRAYESQGAYVLDDEIGEQGRHLGRCRTANGGTAFAVQLGERWLPQREDGLSAW